MSLKTGFWVWKWLSERKREARQKQFKAYVLSSMFAFLWHVNVSYLPKLFVEQETNL